MRYLPKNILGCPAERFQKRIYPPKPQTGNGGNSRRKRAAAAVQSPYKLGLRKAVGDSGLSEPAAMQKQLLEEMQSRSFKLPESAGAVEPWPSSPMNAGKAPRECPEVQRLGTDGRHLLEKCL